MLKLWKYSTTSVSKLKMTPSEKNMFILSLRFLVVALVIPVVGATKNQRFRINFGSCHDVREPRCTNESMNIWSTIASRSGDLWIWGGDNIYGDRRPTNLGEFLDKYQNISALLATFPKPLFDPASPQDLRKLYKKLSNVPQYKMFVESIGKENIIGIWDDHDYGLNDAGKNYAWKEESQQAFLDFFEVSENSERRIRKGIYNFHDVFESQIRVILLDNRYHKDDYSNKSGDFLGEDQWKWLQETLNQSTAKVNIIVSGLQILPDHPLRNNIETWNRLPQAREKLFKTIFTTSAQGVVLISGDVHFAEIMMANCSCTGDDDGSTIQFKLPELTASGLTHSWGSVKIVYAFLKLFFGINPLQYRIDKKYFLGKNFGELDFEIVKDDLDSSILNYRLFDQYGQSHLSHSWRLSDLKSMKHVAPNNFGNCKCIPNKGTKSSFEMYSRAAIFVSICLAIIASTFVFLCVLLWKLIRLPYVLLKLVFAPGYRKHKHE